MREFTKVSPTIWNSERFRTLPDDARLLQIYFITSGHQNACGCFALPDGYAITDLLLPLERYQAARSALTNATMVLFDQATSEILVCKWFRHNPPMNPSHRKSIVAAIERIASQELRAAAWQGLTDAEAEARARQEAKATQAAAGNPLLRTPHLARVR
jgi:hypothetical protein